MPSRHAKHPSPQASAPASRARRRGSARPRRARATAPQGFAARRRPRRTARPAASAPARAARAKVGARATALLGGFHLKRGRPGEKDQLHAPAAQTSAQMLRGTCNPCIFEFVRGKFLCLHCETHTAACTHPQTHVSHRHVCGGHLPNTRSMQDAPKRLQPRNRGVRRAATQGQRHGVQHWLLPGRRVHRWARAASVHVCCAAAVLERDKGLATMLAACTHCATSSLNCSNAV